MAETGNYKLDNRTVAEVTEQMGLKSEDLRRGIDNLSGNWYSQARTFFSSEKGLNFLATKWGLRDKQELLRPGTAAFEARKKILDELEAKNPQKREAQT